MRATVEAPDGARARLSDTVAALRSTSSFPGDVGGVTALETHMSWVFLTEAHAYKLKKPLRTARLDYTTLQARREACAVELRLNRRLAPTVYLDVVPVVAHPDGLRVEAPGAPVDWLVKMRRLPRDRMLDACIARDAVQAAEIDQLAARLGGFYETAEPAPEAADAYRARITSDLEAKHASLAQRRYGLDTGALASVRSSQQRWLAQHGDRLDARARAIVDAHGDLRPEHVCLERPPVVIDCLEFDRGLRLLDPISELSFLALECRRLGAPWIGERLLANQTARSGAVPASLIHFYQSQHAVIRAAVAVWHLDDEALDHSDRWRARAHEYLHLASSLLDGGPTGPPAR